MAAVHMRLQAGLRPVQGMTRMARPAARGHRESPMKPFLKGLLPALTICGTAHALDIETAREMDLDGLRGLGPATTRQILHARERAPFRDWADLQRRVRGLGPQTAQGLSDQGLRIRGQAYDKAGSAPAAASAQGKP